MTPPDLDTLIARLSNYNPPDRTVEDYKQAAQDILDAKAAIEQLQAELEQIAWRIEPHWKGAGMPLEAKWIIAAWNQRSEELSAAEDVEAERDALRAELEAVKRKIDELFPVIAHGDDKHRAWLKDAIEKHFDAARMQAGDSQPPDNWHEPADGRRLAEHNKDK